MTSASARMGGTAERPSSAEPVSMRLPFARITLATIASVLAESDSAVPLT
jgi:hypothetical protein